MAAAMRLYCPSCGAVSVDGKVSGGSNMNGHQHQFKPYDQQQQGSVNNYSSSSSSVTVINNTAQKPNQVQQKPKQLWYHGRPGDHYMHFKKSPRLLHNQHWDWYEAGWPSDHIVRTKYHCDNFKDIQPLAEEKRLLVCLGHPK